MRTTLLVVMTVAAMLTTQARAADPELSIDTKRLLAYGSLAVMTGACKTSLTPDQASRLKIGLRTSSEAQKDLTQAQFTEAMKLVGSQLGENKAQICGALSPEFIESSLKEAEAGE